MGKTLSSKKPSAGKASKTKAIKKSPSKSKSSAFVKQIQLFRDQKDHFSIDRKYDNW